MTVASIGPALANPTAFTDVPVDFWAYEQINRCVQDGIVSGYSDGHPQAWQPGILWRLLNLLLSQKLLS